MSDATTRYKKTYTVSWEQLHRDSKVLSRTLLEGPLWKGIVAVTRGGLVPAAIVARELEIRLIDTVCVASYAWKDQTEGKVLKGMEGEGEGWLVIDDLVDTGRTARVVRSMLPKALFATVYVKPQGKPLVDTFVAEVSQDTWILFPWDTESQFVEPLAGHKGIFR